MHRTQAVQTYAAPVTTMAAAPTYGGYGVAAPTYGTANYGAPTTMMGAPTTTMAAPTVI